MLKKIVETIRDIMADIAEKYAVSESAVIWKGDYCFAVVKDGKTVDVRYNEKTGKISDNADLGLCVDGSLRQKVAEFIDHSEILSKFKGEKYFELEDELVEFVSRLGK